MDGLRECVRKSQQVNRRPRSIGFAAIADAYRNIHCGVLGHAYQQRELLQRVIQWNARLHRKQVIRFGCGREERLVRSDCLQLRCSGFEA